MTRPAGVRALHVAFAAAGALVFLVALGAGVWLFVVRLAVIPREAAVLPAAAINVALFTAFALHHSVMARTGAKAWLSRHWPAHLERATFVWIASLLFLAVCGFWQPVPGLAWNLEGPWRWPGLFLQGAGVGLTYAGARLLDVFDLSGIRQVTSAGRGAPVQPHAGGEPLTRRGPYGFVRHPIYTGWLLMTFAAPTMTGGRLLFAVVSAAYLVAAIPFEERSLVEEHGQAYREYQRAVRWRMVPGIY